MNIFGVSTDKYFEMVVKKGRSLMYIKNSKGPRIGPDGTPVCKGNKSDSI